MDIPADIKNDRNEMKKRLYLIFKGKVDLEVVDIVLADSQYQEYKAYENLLLITGEQLPKTPNKSQLLNDTVSSSPTSKSIFQKDKPPENIFQQILTPIPPISEISQLMMSPPEVNRDSHMKLFSNSTNVNHNSSSLSNIYADASSSVNPFNTTASYSPAVTTLFPTRTPSTELYKRDSIGSSSKMLQLDSVNQKDEALKRYLNHPSHKVMILMRGLPGSGKSYKANLLNGAHGVVLSTDDYFYKNKRYEYCPASIPDAHQWNQIRARKAMKANISPIFIDNTNLKIWEMKPYIEEGNRYGYTIKVFEPDTQWAWKPSDLARKNKHGVSQEKIMLLMGKYEPITCMEDLLGCNRKPKTAPNHRSNKTNYKPTVNVEESASLVKPYPVFNENEYINGGQNNGDHNIGGHKNGGHNIGDHDNGGQDNSGQDNSGHDNGDHNNGQIITSNTILKTDDTKSKVDFNVHLDIERHIIETHNRLSNITNTVTKAKKSPLLPTPVDSDAIQKAFNTVFNSRELSDASKSCLNNENDHAKTTLIADESLNISSSSSQIQSDLHFLYECFPDYARSYCKNWLKRYNGDLVKTCDYLARLSQVDDLPEDVTELGDTPGVDEVGTNTSDALTPDETQHGELFYCDDDHKNILKVAIDKRLGVELIKKYSNETFLIDELSNDDLTLDMDVDFGRELFYMWKKSMKARKRKAQSLLDDDERYAAQLQQEADNETLRDTPDGKKKKKKEKALPIATNFSNNEPAQINGLFSPRAWDRSSPLLPSSPLRPSSTQTNYKDASALTLTPKQLQLTELMYQSFPGADEDALSAVLQSASYNIDVAKSIVQNSCEFNQYYRNINEDHYNAVTSKKKPNIDKEKGAAANVVAGADKKTPIVVSPDNEDDLFQSMTEENQGYRDFRTEANVQANLRAECFQKAAKASQQKQGELAQFYAAKAHEHTLKMKEAHARAAEIILLKKNKVYMKDQQIIDLHELHADEAVRAVKNFIDNAFNVGHAIIYIITGHGKHSKNGVSKIRPAVQQLLKQRKHRYETLNSGGMLKVYLNKH